MQLDAVGRGTGLAVPAVKEAHACLDLDTV